MITNKEEAWDARDNNRNNSDHTSNSFSRQNEDVFNSNELDDDELKEDEDAYTNDLKPTFNQKDLNNEDEEYDRPDEVPEEDNDNELPEEGQIKKEGSGYYSQPEVDQPMRGADTSYSEKNDVTPPNKKEFPSEGPAKTDFESRPQGRTTGRMIGHEPGTEGI
ncbi:hypothetical protein SAMN05421821_104122 [Mucilaginibacter lappiensis]|uniref:Uncharacterized protein n=1 Tax=Mucilaginibacter lappiensis TaxID=354630 RepID=A0ABR6PIA5_9SPHI|nr:hypothetical protein [Mucilaginibacter lappiensis]MBB6109465.1 hypothetical protein [Mucilaginibacter lappiensis]SIQ94252.1 hypothetical protein SAMN05421821_104122 [Mucilaginibacter lappiensis]